jgi:hypothetical protein
MRVQLEGLKRLLRSARHRKQLGLVGKELRKLEAEMRRGP